MRRHNVKKIAFASSAAALGEPSVFPTPETCPIPMQTSLYGASKMACEGMISAYCEAAQMEGYIFRFVSLLGHRYPHGHVFDFCRALLQEPTRLAVLGDGSQRKSFLNIKDCIRAMTHVIEQETAKDSAHNCQIYHLGHTEVIEIRQSVQWICERLNVSPELEYAGGKRGWVGDSPYVFLDTTKIASTGWKPQFSIKESIQETVDWLVDNAWIFESR